MLRSIKELYNYTLEAEDGLIGRCKDFLFDDQSWTIRCMVADTSKWLIGRKVLISPISLGEPDWGSRLFPVRLTKKQIEEAPDLDEHAPVSRQHEIKWSRYYGWPYYWEGTGLWGAASYPSALFIQKQMAAAEQAEKAESEEKDEHLRSIREVTGYHIHAKDGSIGHVDDFILDDETWSIRYMIVDTRNWIPGRKILASPGWIEAVNWAEKEVQVGLTKEAIQNGPEYNPSEPINREYEVRLYDFYGRPKYWEDE